jgi:hypothetical protein
MNEERYTWRQRAGSWGGRGLFWGLTLIAGGSFWLLGDLDIVPEPGKIVFPGLVILWGLATLAGRRDSR